MRPSRPRGRPWRRRAGGLDFDHQSVALGDVRALGEAVPKLVEVVLVGGVAGCDVRTDALELWLDQLEGRVADLVVDARLAVLDDERAGATGREAVLRGLERPGQLFVGVVTALEEIEFLEVRGELALEFVRGIDLVLVERGGLDLVAAAVDEALDDVVLGVDDLVDGRPGAPAVRVLSANVTSPLSSSSSR